MNYRFKKNLNIVQVHEQRKEKTEGKKRVFECVRGFTL